MQVSLPRMQHAGSPQGQSQASRWGGAGWAGWAWRADLALPGGGRRDSAGLASLSHPAWSARSPWVRGPGGASCSQVQAWPLDVTSGCPRAPLHTGQPSTDGGTEASGVSGSLSGDHPPSVAKGRPGRGGVLGSPHPRQPQASGATGINKLIPGEDKGNGGLSPPRRPAGGNAVETEGATARLEAGRPGRKGREEGRTDTGWEGKGRGHGPAERGGRTEEEEGRVVTRVEETGPQGGDSDTGQR